MPEYPRGPAAYDHATFPSGDAAGSTPAGTTPRYAGFWLRAGAILIDLIIVSAFVFLIAFLAALSGADLSPGHGGVSGIIRGVSAAVFLTYFTTLESSKWQATIGKRACGLKVTDLSGQRISRGRAFGRYVGKFLSGLILCIGYLMAAFTEKKQALHDKMAGTLVVKR